MVFTDPSPTYIIFVLNCSPSSHGAFMFTLGIVDIRPKLEGRPIFTVPLVLYNHYL